MDAFSRGFGIAFTPSLIGSLVTLIIETGWMEAPMGWKILADLRDMVLKSISLALAVSLTVGLLVFCTRAVLTRALKDS